MESHFEIEKLRKKIDQVDTELVTLLITRLNLAQKIGKLKQKNSITIEDSNREISIIHHLQQIAYPHITASTIAKIWQEIFLICREVQRT